MTLAERTGKTTIPFEQEIWTTEEVAAYLRVSPDMVRIEAKKKRIPGAFQIGTLWRFRRDEILTWARGPRKED